MVAIRCFTYNQSAYITDALNGFVMQQTNFPFVAMIVDDASTDDEPKILLDYYSTNFDSENKNVAYQENTDYGTVLFAQHKTNRNCFFAVLLLKENHYRQRKSKSPYLARWTDNSNYLALCEGDDYWTDPNKLQKQVDFLEGHPEFGLCYTDFDLFDQGGHVFERAIFEKGIYKRPTTFEEHLVDCGFLAPMSWLYRKSVYDGLELKTFTDGTFSIALAFLKQSKVFYLPEVTCVYRGHKGSRSRPTGAKGIFKQYLGVFKTQLYYAEKYQVDEQLICFIKSGSYIRLLPSAIESKQDDFIEEASLYFRENNINFNELIKLCDAYLNARNDARQARRSRPYKIGKAMLRPFAFIHRIKKSNK